MEIKVNGASLRRLYGCGDEQCYCNTADLSAIGVRNRGIDLASSFTPSRIPGNSEARPTKGGTPANRERNGPPISIRFAGLQIPGIRNSPEATRSPRPKECRKFRDQRTFGTCLRRSGRAGEGKPVSGEG